MGTGGAKVLPDDVTPGVDPKSSGDESTRNVDAGKRAGAQQKAMDFKREAAVLVLSYNIASRVYPKGFGEGSTGGVDCGERVFAPQKAMGTGGVSVTPHDIAFGVDPKSQRGGSTGNVDRGETVFFCTTTADHANGKQEGKTREARCF